MNMNKMRRLALDQASLLNKKECVINDIANIIQWYASADYNVQDTSYVIVEYTDMFGRDDEEPITLKELYKSKPNSHDVVNWVILSLEHDNRMSFTYETLIINVKAKVYNTIIQETLMVDYDEEGEIDISKFTDSFIEKLNNVKNLLNSWRKN